MKQETTVVIKCINYYRHHHYHHCYYHWFINFQFKKQIFHIVYDHLLQKLIFIFPVHTTLILLNLTSLLLRSLALKAPFKPGNWRQKKTHNGCMCIKLKKCPLMPWQALSHTSHSWLRLTYVPVSYEQCKLSVHNELWNPRL